MPSNADRQKTDLIRKAAAESRKRLGKNAHRRFQSRESVRATVHILLFKIVDLAMQSERFADIVSGEDDHIRLLGHDHFHGASDMVPTDDG